MSSANSIVIGDSLKEDQERIRQIRKNKLFRRIEADIKERDRKRKPGRPEQYVDRDRIIAVTIGESDIRDTMVKQRMFISKNSNVVYEDEANYKILIQQAEYELHKGSYERALSYLNKAICICPEDTVSLMLRGACLVGVQEFQQSIEDINVVIRFDPSSRAHLVKGDALYHLGEFEHCLVQYHRALFRACTTKEDEAIRFGIGRAEKAIDNALGAQATSHFMTMSGLIRKIPSTIFNLRWQDIQDLKRKEDFFQPKQPSSRLPYYQQRKRATNARNLSKKESKYQRELLGKLCKDLDYLEGLSAEIGGSKGKDKEINIKQEAEEAITFLKNRQDFWRQFKPMYSGSHSLKTGLPHS